MSDHSWETCISLTDDGEVAYAYHSASVLADITGEEVSEVISLTLVTEQLEKCGIEVKNLDDPANAALLADLTSPDNLGGLTPNDAESLVPNPDGFGYESQGE